MIEKLGKTLSQNDLGKNNSHQAGFHIPKSIVQLDFFPKLPADVINPRLRLKCVDTVDGRIFFASYIHYNSKRLGLGTRDEYRITGLTTFIRANGLLPGDRIIFLKSAPLSFSLQVEKVERSAKTLSSESWLAIYGTESR